MVEHISWVDHILNQHRQNYIRYVFREISDGILCFELEHGCESNLLLLYDKDIEIALSIVPITIMSGR